MLAADGSLLESYSYPAEAVEAIALAPTGALLQVGSSVEIRRGSTSIRSVDLPDSARMLDFAERRILYSVGGSIHTLHIGTGVDSTLVKGSATPPVLAALDPHGFAWARGSRVNWDCAVCITF